MWETSACNYGGASWGSHRDDMRNLEFRDQAIGIFCEKAGSDNLKIQYGQHYNSRWKTKKNGTNGKGIKKKKLTTIKWK